MVKRLVSAAAVILAVVLSGCGHRGHIVTETVPPRIDLKEHEVIGVIDFGCSAEGELGPVTTGHFIDAARQDQGLVRIVRLGSESEALASVDQTRLDPAACKALGEKHGLQTIVTGSLTISEVHPNIDILQGLTRAGVSADVDVELAVQMVETATGASLWSDSAAATQRVAGLSVFGGKRVTFDAADPERAYGQLANSLVEAVTHDFRATYRRVRVP
jgi:hypothetical protein